MLINNIFNDYIDNLKIALSTIDIQCLKEAAILIESTIKNKNKIYVCGNGGSAAISDHFCCDHSKGIFTNTGLKSKVHSLSSNIALLTALANDISYTSVYAEQVKIYGEPDDLLVVISSSGTSSNILEAIQAAKLIGMRVIALTGFTGGSARTECNVSIHVNADNYGIVEDCHQAVMHMLAQCISINNSIDFNKLRL